MKTTKETINCDFCGKVAGFVDMMIASKDNVHICNECVDLSVQIIQEERMKKIQKESKEVTCDLVQV